jgi:hypothetical protein
MHKHTLSNNRKTAGRWKLPALAVIAVFLLTMAVFSAVAAGASAQNLLIDNDFYVSAYPLAIQKNPAPIALTRDMIAPRGIAIDAIGRIYVTNGSTNTVTAYREADDGNVLPFAVIGGAQSHLQNPIGIGLDASGKIYVLNSETQEITIYPSLSAKGGVLREQPVATIGGSATLIDRPVGIAVDATGNVYVANRSSGPNESTGCAFGYLTVYAAGSSGNVAPSTVISGCATQLSTPVAIAIDSSDDIYVANSDTANSNVTDNPSITVYSAASIGNASPIAVIAGAATALSSPQAIAVDTDENIYVTDDTTSGNGINVYPAGGNGDVSPTATIAGRATKLASTTGITLDSRGNIYALNSFGGPTYSGSVTVYPNDSSGDVTPIATITSSLTGIVGSDSVTVDSAGTIVLTNSDGGPDLEGSLTIYPAGSYAAGRPAASIAGRHTGLNYPISAAVDAAGNISVFNLVSKTVTTYLAGSRGDVAPSRTIAFGKRDTPVGVAIGLNNILYVANAGASDCNSSDCNETNPGSISIYPDPGSGAASPVASLSGPATELASPSAIAVSNRGNLYVMNEGQPFCNSCGCIANGIGSITAYSPDSTGNARPFESIKGPNTGLLSPIAIAMDSNENIYVLVSGEVFESASGCDYFFFGLQYAIEVFRAGANGDAAPIATIGVPAAISLPGIEYEPSAIAIGPAAP